MIIAFLEPRINGEIADNVYKRLGKQNWVQVEVRRFMRGIGCYEIGRTLI